MSTPDPNVANPARTTNGSGPLDRAVGELTAFGTGFGGVSTSEPTAPATSVGQRVAWGAQAFAALLYVTAVVFVMIGIWRGDWRATETAGVLVVTAGVAFALGANYHASGT